MSGRDFPETIDQAPALNLSLAGAVVGDLVAMASDGSIPMVLVPLQACAQVLQARSVVDIEPAHIGRPVVLLFERGDPSRPIIMGVIRRPEAPSDMGTSGLPELAVDGERLLVSARQQLVLKCGKASITLTRAGKVLIHGTYVCSASSGVNRVKGGAVQLN